MAVKGDPIIGLHTPSIPEDPDRPPKRYVSDGATVVHAGLLFAAAVSVAAAFALLVGGLPCETAALQGAQGTILALVLIAGTAGGLIHALTSFATFAGNRQLAGSWLPWLYLRAPIGGLLGLVVYLGLRAGAVGTLEAGTLTCQGFNTIVLSAALAGLFSKQVADKLSDVVDNLIAPSRRPERLDALDRQAATPPPSTGSPAASVPDETVQRVQRRLIALGVLPGTRADGTPGDGGILDGDTRAAIERFLADHGIVGNDRRQTVGNETDPDFWPKLLDLLDAARVPAATDVRGAA